MNTELKYYVAIFKRRFHYFALIFVAVNALALTMALRMQHTYESRARLILEMPQVSNQATSSDGGSSDLEKLQIIEQKIMTRQNLIDIARKFHVLPPGAQRSPDIVARLMQANTDIENNWGRDRATVVTVAFRAGNPDTAAAVVHHYVQLLLDGSAEMQKTQAKQTLAFYEQEVHRLSAALDAQSDRIVSFQKKHKDALPNTLNFRMTKLSDLQTRQASIQGQISDLRDKKQRMLQIYRETGRIDGVQVGGDNPQAKALDDLRNELAQSEAVLSSRNPKIVLLKSQIARLEASMKKNAEAQDGSGAQGGAGSLLSLQTSDLDTRIKSLEQQQADTTAQLASLQSSINQTSTNEVILDGLKRDYANIQSQYNAAVDRLAKARTGERMVSQDQIQRLSVLDPATPPDYPLKGRRKLIALMGFLAGAGLGIGAIVLRELLDNSLRRPADLTRALGITPIGVLPYVRTEGEKFRRRAVLAAFLVLLAVGVPLTMYAVNRYYMPLDLISAKINKKLGI